MRRQKSNVSLMAGTMLALVGIGYAMSDRRTRKRMMKDSRRVASRASDVIDGITDLF